MGYSDKIPVSPNLPDYQDYLPNPPEDKGIVRYTNWFIGFLTRCFRISVKLKEDVVNISSVATYICERYLDIKEPEQNKKILEKM